VFIVVDCTVCYSSMFHCITVDNKNVLTARGFPCLVIHDLDRINRSCMKCNGSWSQCITLASGSVNYPGYNIGSGIRELSWL
jgi:antirestriction protein